MQEEKEYLTLEEAYTYLGVSRATLFNYVKRGLIQRYQREAPRSIFYNKLELDQLKRIKPKRK